jgi:hypothetical protein
MSSSKTNSEVRLGLKANDFIRRSISRFENEIYLVSMKSHATAGGLDRTADRYVCFYEKAELKTFFLFAENKYLREYMIANGTFETLSKEQQEEMKKDFLIFRGFDQGVPAASEDYLYVDGTSWRSKTAPYSKSTSIRSE